MLTWEDCLALCELDEDVIDAIAEHEHIPEMAALELGDYLVHHEDGVPRIRRMILDDIENAQAACNETHVAELKRTLAHFVAYARAHPAGKA